MYRCAWHRLVRKGPTAISATALVWISPTGKPMQNAWPEKPIQQGWEFWLSSGLHSAPVAAARSLCLLRFSAFDWAFSFFSTAEALSSLEGSEESCELSGRRYRSRKLLLEMEPWNQHVAKVHVSAVTSY